MLISHLYVYIHPVLKILLLHLHVHAGFPQHGDSRIDGVHKQTVVPHLAYYGRAGGGAGALFVVQLIQGLLHQPLGVLDGEVLFRRALYDGQLYLLVL